MKWENAEPQTMMVNGEEVITTDSTLICKVSGREIYAVTSGQEKENPFAEYKKTCEEMERDYPGLLAILVDPHGSLYLQEGMYEIAIQFLEDYVNEAKNELLLSEIYAGKNPKDIFAVAALDRLLTDCDGSTFEQLINGLEITGAQTGIAQNEGWDVLKLNQRMLEILKIDCKATSEKVNTSSFARWTEEHKKFVNILGNTVLQLAYDVMIWHCTTASSATKAARNAGGKGSTGTCWGDLMSSKDAELYNAWTDLREAGLDQAKINDIILTNKGFRPDPVTYLSQEYIDKHLVQFKDGASIIMTNEQYVYYVQGNAFIGIPSDGTQFVMPKNYCDDIAGKAGSDISYYEKALGFDSGHFSNGGGLVRIDIENLNDLNLRLPSGNEAGANSHWIPGGQTEGGIPEAITNLIPNVSDNITIIKIK